VVETKVPRVFLVLVAILLLFLSSPTPALGDGEHLVYLPFVAYPCPQPTLYSPEDAAQLDTLTPVFQFGVPVITGVTGAALHVSPNPSFMPLEYSITSDSGGGEFTWKVYYNLTPAATYYWRAVTICQGSVKSYSEIRTFLTGSGGEFPPAPVLLSPADGSTTASTSVTFEWSQVVGATGYLLNYQGEGSSWMTVPLTDTQRTRSLQPGKNYIWYVQPLNAYGIGESSPTWHFTTPNP